MMRTVRTALADLQTNWEMFGRRDPLWAICGDPMKRGNQWDSDEFFRTGEKWIDHVMADLQTLGLFVDRERALDFGCGVGRLTQALAQHFGYVDGVDIAPSMIRTAEQFNRYGSRVRYILNEAADLRTLTDRSYDLVLSLVTLQHIPSVIIRSYLEEFLRVLRPNGVLVFNLPGGPRTAPPRDPLTLLKCALKTLPLAVRLYRQLTGPEMQMHAIPREEIVGYLKAREASVMDVRPDNCGGRDWESYRYVVTLNSPSP